MSQVTEGVGLMSMDSMEPEVLQAWQEFSAGELKEEALTIRMRIIQPALKARKRKSRLYPRGRLNPLEVCSVLSSFDAVEIITPKMTALP